VFESDAAKESQMKSRLVWIAFAIVMALASVGWVALRVVDARRTPLVTELAQQARAAREVAPDTAQVGADALLAMMLPDLDGKPQALAQWRGKLLVLNYWASWCPPCIEEMPLFSQLHTQHAARGVQFVGIGLDETEKMRAFAAKTPVSYPLLAGGTAGSGTPGLSVRGLPYTVIVGRDGKVLFSRYGRVDAATLEPFLR
jgi:thiol-disulfide isomerase/thioredoxin